MKIIIDQDSCISCGACEDACGEIFEVKSDEKASIVAAHRSGSPAEGEAGEDLRECAQSGVDVCTVDAIRLE